LSAEDLEMLWRARRLEEAADESRFLLALEPNEENKRRWLQRPLSFFHVRSPITYLVNLGMAILKSQDLSSSKISDLQTAIAIGQANCTTARRQAFPFLSVIVGVLSTMLTRYLGTSSRCCDVMKIGVDSCQVTRTDLKKFGEAK